MLQSLEIAGCLPDDGRIGPEKGAHSTEKEGDRLQAMASSPKNFPAQPLWLSPVACRL
jgi:hypothetical protein